MACYRPSAPPTRAACIRGEAFFPPSGFLAPQESVRTGVRIYVHRASCPSWAFSSLRYSPRSWMGRISPPLLSRASTHRTPEVSLGCLARRRPRVSLPSAVALSLSRPPDRFEVARPQLSRLLGTCPALAYFVRLEPQVTSPSLVGPLRAVARPDQSETRQPGRRCSGRFVSPNRGRNLVGTGDASTAISPEFVADEESPMISASPADNSIFISWKRCGNKISRSLQSRIGCGLARF